MKKLVALAVALAAFAFHVAAQDMPLSMLLIDGQDWKLAVDGLTFADGPTADAQGNLYFCDMRSEPPVVWKVAPDGSKSKLNRAASKKQFPISERLGPQAVKNIGY